MRQQSYSLFLWWLLRPETQYGNMGESCEGILLQGEILYNTWKLRKAVIRASKGCKSTKEYDAFFAENDLFHRTQHRVKVWGQKNFEKRPMFSRNIWFLEDELILLKIQNLENLKVFKTIMGLSLIKVVR